MRKLHIFFAVALATVAFSAAALDIPPDVKAWLGDTIVQQRRYYACDRNGGFHQDDSGKSPWKQPCATFQDKEGKRMYREAQGNTARTGIELLAFRIENGVCIERRVRDEGKPVPPPPGVTGDLCKKTVYVKRQPASPAQPATKQTPGNTAQHAPAARGQQSTPPERSCADVSGWTARAKCEAERLQKKVAQ